MSERANLEPTEKEIVKSLVDEIIMDVERGAIADALELLKELQKRLGQK